jgi:hypothetical protein
MSNNSSHILGVLALTTGLKDIIHPKVEEIKVWDWAWGLHHQPRWSGATPVLWDVLSHTGLVFMLAMQETKGKLNPLERLGILLHDATEGMGMSDLPTPLKDCPEFKIYREIEERMMRTIFQRFGVDYDAVDWKLVKRYDAQALYVERTWFFSWRKDSKEWGIKPQYPIDVAKLGRPTVAQPMDYVKLLRDLAINLGTQDVNALFEMPEWLKPYADPENYRAKDYGEVVDGDILKAGL